MPTLVVFYNNQPLTRRAPAGESAGALAALRGRVALLSALVGSLILSYYSVKYWHIHLSDLLSMLGNVTVSSTVTIPAPTLRPENIETNSKFLLQRKGLVKMRSQNELSFAQNELVGDVNESGGTGQPYP